MARFPEALLPRQAESAEGNPQEEQVLSHRPAAELLHAPRPQREALCHGLRDPRSEPAGDHQEVRLPRHPSAPREGADEAVTGRPGLHEPNLQANPHRFEARKRCYRSHQK